MQKCLIPNFFRKMYNGALLVAIVTAWILRVTSLPKLYSSKEHLNLFNENFFYQKTKDVVLPPAKKRKIRTVVPAQFLESTIGISTKKLRYWWPIPKIEYVLRSYHTKQYRNFIKINRSHNSPNLNPIKRNCSQCRVKLNQLKKSSFGMSCSQKFEKIFSTKQVMKRLASRFSLT